MCVYRHFLLGGATNIGPKQDLESPLQNKAKGNVSKQGRNTHSLSLMSVTISPCSTHSLPARAAGTRDLLKETSRNEQPRAMG